MRFLIDECLTVRLVAVAVEGGYEAHHIAHLDMAGEEDWDVAFHALERDFVLVTNNAVDFWTLYANYVLHPGLVILLPNVKADLQSKLFKSALRRLEESGEPVNQVLEVDVEGEEVVCRLYDLPSNQVREPQATAHLRIGWQ